MPRKLAFEILKKAQKNSAYLNIALDTALNLSELSMQDKALCSIITLGVTERRITLDYYIDNIASDPKRIDTDTRLILEIALYQMMYLDRIPEYAAVNEAVNMSKRKSAGFVNAILRNFMRKKDKIALPEDKLSKMSVECSYPYEICKKFADIYGMERAKNILDIFNESDHMTLRLNTLKTDKESYIKLLENEGISFKENEYVKNAVTVKGISFDALPMSDEGYFFIQDVASQICVEAMGAKSGDIIIDTCSCPGSKSFGMAINMNNFGRVISCDLHKSKLSLIESGAKRLSLDIIETHEMDGRVRCEEYIELADGVLCDVPCSGLGVMGKKPEIRYKDLNGIERLPDIQLDILKNASGYVKKGGVLVYSTCTVLPCENELNIERFLDGNDNFVREDFTVGDIKSHDGYIRLDPDIHKTDGFFVCKMRRVK